ncbi:glycosyltransferase [Bacteriovorax sp. Seq25_V]|uniref:glycosyltransferase n=1 Tax=Bacteriovorax sp. Seq25_V TaxID=1201288 RepID=UPI0012FAE211|nr:glycosyltransferase [Bacteriovorax sp. Seq25_V]
MIKINDSITIIVPAKNEEDNIERVLLLLAEVSNWWNDFKVIAVDDGSSDQTNQKIAEFQRQNNLSLTLIRNEKSKNLGGAFKQCLPLVDSTYIMVVQGQGDFTLENFKAIFSHVNMNKDMIIPYQLNFMERPFHRRLFSSIFTKILNIKHNLRLYYFNHSVLMKTNDVKEIEITSDSYGYQAEILIKLLKKEKSYLEVGVRDNFEHKKKTNAFKLGNIIGVIKFIISI